jgi:hypothetical protein
MKAVIIKATFTELVNATFITLAANKTKAGAFGTQNVTTIYGATYEGDVREEALPELMVTIEPTDEWEIAPRDGRAGIKRAIITGIAKADDEANESQEAEREAA